MLVLSQGFGIFAVMFWKKWLPSVIDMMLLGLGRLVRPFIDPWLDWMVVFSVIQCITPGLAFLGTIFVIIFNIFNPN